MQLFFSKVHPAYHNIVYGIISSRYMLELPHIGNYNMYWKHMFDGLEIYAINVFSQPSQHKLF